VTVLTMWTNSVLSKEKRVSGNPVVILHYTPLNNLHVV